MKNNKKYTYKSTENSLTYNHMENDFDNVNHPTHYTEGRQYEPIDVIYDWRLDFCCANALKYISRAGRKNNAVEDLEKAVFYLNYKIKKLKENKNA